MFIIKEKKIKNKTDENITFTVSILVCSSLIHAQKLKKEDVIGF
jgi:hypothetical protein